MWKLASVKIAGEIRVALQVGERLVDVQYLGAELGLTRPSLSMLELLREWQIWHDLLHSASERLEQGHGFGQNLMLDPQAVRCAPVLYPGKLLCAMGNYGKHVREMAGGAKDVYKQESGPLFFLKPPSGTVVGPEDDIVLPAMSQQVDWEIELAVVIGKTAKHVPRERAMEYVAGYTVLNDITARDRLVRQDLPAIINRDWLTGKGFDSFAPMGPCLVPASQIANPHDLAISLSVNGTVHQDANTEDMIFRIDEQIEHLTRIMTLEPGDVISTGTPEGVGFMKGIFLKPGDLVVGEVQHIGALRNRVVASS